VYQRGVKGRAPDHVPAALDRLRWCATRVPREVEPDASLGLTAPPPHWTLQPLDECASPTEAPGPAPQGTPLRLVCATAQVDGRQGASALVQGRGV